MKTSQTSHGKRCAELREAAARHPDSAAAQARLGTAWLQAGAGRKAEKALRRAIELDPGYAEAWVNLGGVQLMRWDFAGCVDSNRRALECQPDLLQAHYNMGLGYLYQGKAGPMVTCFQQVLRLDPRHAGGHYHLAVGLLALGKVQAARVSLSRATELGASPQPELLKALERDKGGKVSTHVIDSGGANGSGSDRVQGGA